MAGSIIYGGQSVDTGAGTVTEGVGTVSSTGIVGYDSSKVPTVVPIDANDPGRKVAPEGAVTLLANPTVTGGNPLTANTDGTVVFSQRVREVWVRNLSATVDCYLEPDNTASTASWPVLAGESVCLGMFVTTLHIYPTGAISVNVAGGLSIRGGI